MGEPRRYADPVNMRTDRWARDLLKQLARTDGVTAGELLVTLIRREIERREIDPPSSLECRCDGGDLPPHQHARYCPVHKDPPSDEEPWPVHHPRPTGSRPIQGDVSELHGTIRGYWRGCRCVDCRLARAEYYRQAPAAGVG